MVELSFRHLFPTPLSIGTIILWVSLLQLLLSMQIIQQTSILGTTLVVLKGLDLQQISHWKHHKYFLLRPQHHPWNANLYLLAQVSTTAVGTKTVHYTYARIA